MTDNDIDWEDPALEEELRKQELHRLGFSGVRLAGDCHRHWVKGLDLDRPRTYIKVVSVIRLHDKPGLVTLVGNDETTRVYAESDRVASMTDEEVAFAKDYAADARDAAMDAADRDPRDLL